MRFLKKALLAGAAVVALSAAAFPNPPAEQAPPAGSTAKIVLAGGCFWGMEGVFESLRGVRNVVSGYSGGAAATAHYELVSTGTTGHAESVELTYDPAKISFAQILEVYFLVAHDPTELDRQGPDDGTQYRSEIFYTTPQQLAASRAYIAKLTSEKIFNAPIVTQLAPLRGFYPAEAYHQNFVAHNPDNPYVVYNDLPKLQKLKEKFPQLLR